MSFMRGVVENTIRNMSPDERKEAMTAVTRQTIGMMSEQERIDVLTEVLGELIRSVPRERLDEVVGNLSAG